MKIFKRRGSYLVCYVKAHEVIIVCSFKHLWQASAYLGAQ